MPVDWNFENAAHLLRRAGFGASRARIEQALDDGLVATVESLLVPDPAPDTLFTDKPSTLDLQAFWFHRMVTTQSPLQERMVLFFHDHFATAVSKVKKKPLMHRQNQLLRKRCFGKFKTLLLEMIRDPALLRFLDNHLNVKTSPNENFARELQELFTLGVKNGNGNSNYTEQDVAECARAFTGYTVKKNEFVFETSQHDSGTKTFRGVTGKLDGEQIAAMLADDPATARRLARKLWSTFAWPIGLSHPIAIELAGVYLGADGEIASVLRALFRHDAFYSQEAKRGVVRSPVEFLVVALRGLNAKPSSSPAKLRTLGERAESMGQSLFDPPSVFGWPGGKTWVELAGMQQRVAAAQWIADHRQQSAEPDFAFDPGALLGTESEWASLDAAAVVSRVLDALGPLLVTDSTRFVLESYLADWAEGILVDAEFVDRKVRGLLALALSTPEYQIGYGGSGGAS
jgi:uncharacterized protein (DUF1800 family)